VEARPVALSLTEIGKGRSYIHTKIDLDHVMVVQHRLMATAPPHDADLDQFKPEELP
jgi:hypothetical protein